MKNSIENIIVSQLKQIMTIKLFFRCGSDCGKRCDDVGNDVKCSDKCESGCYYKDGYHRASAPNGQCIKLEYCQKTEYKKRLSKKKEFIK